MLVGSASQCVDWVFADVHWAGHWGMPVYTGSHCVALDHNLVGLWFLSLHCSFLLCIRGYAGGMLVVVCGGVHRGFLVFFCFFLCVCLMVVISGCSRGLLLLWIMF